MIAQVRQRVTLSAEQFDAWVDLPENADATYELIAGEVIAVPSNAKASAYVMRIAGELYIYLKANPIAHLTGEAGGYKLGDERYAPDVALVLRSRQADLDPRGYNSVPPSLAVEVDFPSTRATRSQLMLKIAAYLAFGTTVWVVTPEDQQVEIYRPGAPAVVLGREGVIDGGDLLPGFTLAVKAILPDEPPE